ncbi:MAG TPA: T9SS type A sorting domain-containing protein [Catalimonadaceae bacterium]|nr:T9SS type A sorting domain-containing protein [Catalimonadaceae bacterium]
MTLPLSILKTVALLGFVVVRLACAAQPVNTLDFSTGKESFNSRGSECSAVDEAGNFYYEMAKVGFLNDTIRNDTIILTRLNNKGHIAWQQKFGGAGTNGFISAMTVFENKLFLSICFNGEIAIGDSIYTTPTDTLDATALNLGTIVLKMDSSGNLISHRIIGFGRDLYINNFISFKQNSIVASALFTDLVDFLPWGIHRIFLPGQPRQNFCYLELDSNFEFLLARHSDNIFCNTSFHSNMLLKGNLLIGRFKKDTLAFGNIKMGTDFYDYCPFLFVLDSAKNVSKVVQGKNTIPGQPIVDGFTYSVADDSSGNIYCLVGCYGAYEFAGLTIGKPNDVSFGLLKLDPQGNGIWQKTITTHGFRWFGSPMSFDRKANKIWLRTAVQDTFSLGEYHFSEPPTADHKMAIARLDGDGNVEFVKVIGFDSDASIIYGSSIGIDSSGNFYSLMESNFPDDFQADCFEAPEIASFPPDDTVRQYWVKIGPCTLKKDSIITHWPLCDSQRSIRTFYHSTYSPLRYEWSTGDTGAVFSPPNGGTYRLIVSDATCCADTQYFQLPLLPTLPQPEIIGETETGTAFAESYHITIPDSVVIQWTVTGGTVVSGQGTDSITVAWQNPGLGELIVQVSDSAATCFRTDTMQVTITALSQLLTCRTWHVSPNPATSQVRIQGTELGNVHYSLTDLAGKFWLNGSSTQPDFTISIGGLSKGVYILLIQSASGLQTTTKLVIE